MVDYSAQQSTPVWRDWLGSVGWWYLSHTLLLGSIPNGADPTVAWFLSFLAALLAGRF